MKISKFPRGNNIKIIVCLYVRRSISLSDGGASIQIQRLSSYFSRIQLQVDGQWQTDYHICYSSDTEESVDWSTRGTKRPYFGSFCLCFGIVTISLYSICVSVLFKMRSMSVYKVFRIFTLSNHKWYPQIMLFLAAVDIADVFGNSVLFSIALFRVGPNRICRRVRLMNLQGEVYCLHPTIHLYYAMFCQCLPPLAIILWMI